MNTELREPRGGKWMGLGEAVLGSGGLCLFALLAHQAGWLRWASWAGLGIAGAMLALGVMKSARPWGLFGLGEWNRRTIWWAVAGVGAGVVAAAAYRNHMGVPLLTSSITGFALVAMAIGGMEELFFRGYVQGRAKMMGWPTAIILAAALHTGYKVALFVLPGSAGEPGNLMWLVVETLGGGLILGGMRQASRTVVAPLAAHMVFDLLVYGDRLAAPWWVWR